MYIDLKCSFESTYFKIGLREILLKFCRYAKIDIHNVCVFLFQL